MYKHLVKVSIGVPTIALSLILPQLASAQEYGGGGLSSESSSNTEYDNYKSLSKIRDLLDEGSFNKAEQYSIKFIKAQDRDYKNKAEKSELYKEAYNCLCVSLTGLGKVADALEACNRSLEYNPVHWESLKSRATVYYMIQDFDNSLEDFTLSLENAAEKEAISGVLQQNIGVVNSKINTAVASSNVN